MLKMNEFKFFSGGAYTRTSPKKFILVLRIMDIVGIQIHFHIINKLHSN